MIVVGGVIVLTSCSKKSDYTCSCEETSKEDGVVVANSSEVFEYKDLKEDDAEKLCSRTLRII